MLSNSLFSLIGFMAFAFLVSWLWNTKLNWDKKNRKNSSEKFFYVIFGFSALFLALDNWFVLRDVTVASLDGKTFPISNGLASFYQWWGIDSFILGIFAGVTVLSFIYRRIAQTARRLNLFSFYHFLKVRYPGGRWFISIISKISILAAIPFLYYQIRLTGMTLFPDLNGYASLALISAAFILLFLFVSDKSQKLPYLISFIFALAWIILGGMHSYEQEKEIFFSTPDLSLVLSLIFLGLSYYLSVPRNFSIYTQRKIDALKINYLRRCLIFGALFLLSFLFLYIPIGGWKLKAGIPSHVFILSLSFPVTMAQLFFLKTNVYQSFRKYSLNSKILSGLLAVALFLVFIFGLHFLFEKAALDFSKVYLFSLTYFPILLPSFLGGFIFKKAKTGNMILSYTSGFIVWFYLVVVEEFLSMKIEGFNFSVNFLSQTFYPFCTALIFYVIPLFFMRQKTMLASSFTHPENLIIESFFIEMDEEKLHNIFGDSDKMQLFVLFFDHREKSFHHDFIMAKTKLPSNRLDPLLQSLEDYRWIQKKGAYYQYCPQEREIEKKLEKMVASYHTVEGIFRNKVEEDFNEYKNSVIRKAEDLDTQISTLSLLNEVAQEFSRIFDFSLLYRKVAELSVNNLSFEGAEIFLVKQEGENYHFKPVYLFYSNYQHLMFSLEEYEARVNEDSERRQLLIQAVLDKELVVNNPKELEKLKTLPEKYSAMAVYPVFQDNHVFALIQVGYSTEDKSITAQDIQKIEFLVNNVSQSVIVISLYESLEDKINQRTAELQKTNQELVKFNEALKHLDKEIKREMIAASAIQKAILPEEFPYSDRIDVGRKLRAMPDESLTEQERKKIEISGDYYDVFDLEWGRVGILIADVTGHGIPSALITTMSKISFYTHAIEGGTTASICERVNKDIFEAIGVGDTGFYVTVFFAIYDTESGILQYTNAGHHEGLVLRKKSGEMEELNSPGFFIGSFEAAEYGYGEILLNEGDRFLLYTDGVVELRDEKGTFYEDTFYQRIKEYRNLPCQEMVDNIFDEMESFRNDYPVKDDRTLLVIEAKNIPTPAQELPSERKKRIQEEAMNARERKETPENILENSSLESRKQENSTGEKNQKTSIPENQTIDPESLKQQFADVIRKFNKKEFNSALEQEVDALIPVYTDPKMLYYIKGFLLLKREALEEALKVFLEAEKLMPEHSSTLNYIAYLYFKLKNYPAAANYWEKVIQLKPGLASAQQNLEIVKKML